MRCNIRVLIVDDHPVMRQGIRALLEHEADILVVGEAKNGDEGVAQAALLRPDVILMDLQLPGKSGLDAIREIHLENPGIRILVFSNFSEDKTIMEAVKSGAIGYLLKIDAAEKVIQAVRDAYHGSSTLSSQVSHGLLSYIHQHKTAPLPETRLTRREDEILKMMASGLTNEEMSVRTYISEGTVRTHVSHILQKLNLENRAQAVIYAVRSGLVDLDKA